MRKLIPSWFVLVAVMLPTAGQTPGPVPLIQAHSHNDYEQKRPLFDALDLGFCNIEADIYLVEGQLLVAHEREQVQPGKTLQALYLDPLRAHVKRNQGRVFRDGPTVTLLIDVKTDAEKTYAVLRGVLKEYQEMLTVFQSGQAKTNAVTAIISGNRPRKMLAEEPVRYAAYDGRLEDLDSNEPNSFIPWISDDWTKHFEWRGGGPFPGNQKQELRQILEKAHQQGRKVRFWATPDRAEVWSELVKGGVDIIIADNLSALQRFLLLNKRR
ncbi:MAG: phosphatidylinositol-specific phospholipase C/glycerophosphodiester phosphodiesterase family protein [Verrucomicrobiota bacterium]